MEDRFEAFTAGMAAISRCIQKIKSAEMQRHGLRGSHVMCLFYMGKHPEGLSVSELSRLCCEDRAAVSRSLSELEQRGYVRFAPTDCRKRYRTPAVLTESGRDVTESSIAPAITAALSFGGSGLGDDQRRQFYEALCHIAANLEQYCTQLEKEKDGGFPCR